MKEQNMPKTQSKTPAASTTPNMDRVTAKFLEEVQTKGLSHTLQWIDSWYRQEAEAWIHDQAHQAELAEGPGTWKSTSEQQETRRLLVQATAVRNLHGLDPLSQSSMMGSTMRTRALASVAIRMFQASGALGLAKAEDQLWAEIKDRRSKGFTPAASE